MINITLNVPRQHRHQWITISAIALSIPPALFLTVPAIHEPIEGFYQDGLTWKLFGITVLDVPPIQSNAPIAAPIQPGDSIAGYPVTSGFGPRKSPCPGCSSLHNGVDLGTPTGTPLYAPGKAGSSVAVECWEDGGGGGTVANILVDGQKFQALHLSRCSAGKYSPGEVIARTGNTGNGTGPHLDWRQFDATGVHVHPTKDWLQSALTGQRLQPEAFTDEMLTCAIGAAEGTRDDDCIPNAAFNGHIDPGNGAANLGSFSYQHGATTPEEADRRQLARLRTAEETINAQALARWDKPPSTAAMMSALDLYNQAPAAAQDFIKHLPSADPTPEEIVAARAQSFVDPSGELDAPGLGNDWGAVRRDQWRRTDEILNQIQ